MADTKITALTALTAADPANDVIPIVDVSDTSMAASGTTKKISVNNILGASGTATLASATITGDLTVDTSTLKVDSTNNRVIVGHTSGSAAFQVTNAGAAGLEIQPTGFSSAPLIQSYNRSGSAYTQLTLDASTIVHALSGSTAMTLNSTGLGVGIVPSSFGRFSVQGTAGGAGILGMNTDATQCDIQSYNKPLALNRAGNNITMCEGGGNVGIGVTPSVKLDVLSAAAEGTIRLTSTIDGSNASPKASSLSLRSGSASVETARISSFNRFANVGGGDLVFSTQDTSNTLQARATIDSSGQFNIGTSSSLGCRLTVVDTVNNAIVGKNTTALSGVYVAWNAATALDNVFMAFGTETAFAGRGSITYNRAGGLVAYNTTSDYRSKDIIGPVSNSGSLIDSLKVYVGKMKGATVARPMLIAHEAQEIAPYSVTGVKDEVDADGKDKYQQMDVSSFVPLLIAEIQSLRTRVQTLEAR